MCDLLHGHAFIEIHDRNDALFFLEGVEYFGDDFFSCLFGDLKIGSRSEAFIFRIIDKAVFCIFQIGKVNVMFVGSAVKKVERGIPHDGVYPGAEGLRIIEGGEAAQYLEGGILHNILRIAVVLTVTACRFDHEGIGIGHQIIGGL